MRQRSGWVPRVLLQTQAIGMFSLVWQLAAGEQARAQVEETLRGKPRIGNTRLLDVLCSG